MVFKGRSAKLTTRSSKDVSALGVGEGWAEEEMPHRASFRGGHPLGKEKSIEEVVPGGEDTASRVAPHTIPPTTCEGWEVGLASKYKAAVPLARGADMEVPERSVREVSEPVDAQGTLVPGEKRRTQGPMLLKEAILSYKSVAPIASTPADRAGDTLQASPPAFPAAPTTPPPSCNKRCTPASMMSLPAPPKDMLITTDLLRLAMEPRIQFTPIRTWERGPELEASYTRTGMICADFATPKVEPAAMELTHVPCPAASSVSELD